MTTPIAPPRSSYVPLTTTETNTSSDITRVDTEKNDYSAADLLEAGTSLFARTGAGDTVMSPAKTITASKASDTLDEFSAYDGDISDLLAKMASTMASVFLKLRKNALEGQMVSLQTQVKAMQGQAGKMCDAADKNYRAALVQGWTQFAGGAVGLAGGAVALHSSVKAGQEMKKEQGPAPTSAAKASSVADEASSFDDLMVMAQAGKGRPRADAVKGTSPVETTATPVPAESASAASAQHVDLLNARGKLALDVSQSVASLVNSLGSISSAGKKHDAELSEAESKKLEAEVTQAAADLAQENEFAQNWKDSAKSLIDNLKTAIEQEQSAANNVIGNI
jgi:hypothetical protein